MKWAVYLLLVANLAWFAWHFRPGEPPRTRVEAMPEGAARLVLLSEAGQAAPAAPPAAAPEPAVPAAPAPQPAPARSCFTLGPYGVRADAVAARSRLADAGWAMRLRVDDSLQRDGFWVMLPPFASRAAALQAIADLKRKGVKDYFLVAAGDRKNGVSLGVFSERPRAERRLAQVRALGFAARLEPVKLPQRRLWLDGEVQGTPPESAALLDAAGSATGLRVQTIRCAPAG